MFFITKNIMVLIFFWRFIKVKYNIKTEYNITEQMSKQLSILKIISIIMVVFIHANITVHLNANIYWEESISLDIFKYLISENISRVAVPMFFFISSVLLYKKEFSYIDNLKKKIKTLMIPYILCNTIWIIIFLILQNLSFTSVYFTSANNLILNWDLVEWFNRYFYFNINGSTIMYPFVFPLWFIRDLFIMNILSLIIKFLVDKLKFLFLIIILFVWCGNIWIPNEYNLIYLNIQSVVFFTLGYYFVKYNISFESLRRINCLYVSIVYIFMLGINALLFYLNVKLDCIHQISILIGVLFWIRVSSYIVNSNLKNKLMWFQQSIMMIYLFHEFTLTMIRKVLTKVLPQTIIIQLFEYIGAVVITIIITILLDRIIKKYFSNFYKLIVGGRV